MLQSEKRGGLESVGAASDFESSVDTFQNKNELSVLAEFFFSYEKSKKAKLSATPARRQRPVANREGDGDVRGGG
jgi:uncharacterized protein YciU (UPF0263 family)